MSSVQKAFDRHAAVYDHIPSIRRVRSEVWALADPVFRPGSRLLELGCGTGEDAIHFAGRGIDVTAIDVSPEMIGRLKNKSGAIRCEVADMQSYSPGSVLFDGIFSNLGAINCVPRLDWLGALAEAALTPGSHVVLAGMSPFCPLESLMFLFSLQPRQALRRFGRHAEATVEGVRFNVYYHRLRDIRAALGNRFLLKQVAGLPSLFPLPKIATPVDRWLCSHRTTAMLADHFISVWQYE